MGWELLLTRNSSSYSCQHSHHREDGLNTINPARIASAPRTMRVQERNIVAAEIEWDDASRQLAGHEVIEIRRVA